MPFAEGVQTGVLVSETEALGLWAFTPLTSFTVEVGPCNDDPVVCGCIARSLRLLAVASLAAALHGLDVHIPRAHQM